MGRAGRARVLAVLALGALLLPWPPGACPGCAGCVEQGCLPALTCHPLPDAVGKPDCCALAGEPGGEAEALPAARAATAPPPPELVAASAVLAAPERIPSGLLERGFSPAVDRCTLFSRLLL
jgi:hypothetical protein